MLEAKLSNYFVLQLLDEIWLVVLRQRNRRTAEPLWTHVDVTILASGKFQEKPKLVINPIAKQIREKQLLVGHIEAAASH